LAHNTHTHTHTHTYAHIKKKENKTNNQLAILRALKYSVKPLSHRKKYKIKIKNVS